MSDALMLEGVQKGYNRGKPSEVQVLRGATLSVAVGEVWRWWRPRGGEKHASAHRGLLDTPDAGQVALGGRDMVGLSDRARTEARRGEVGFIYQFHHLLPEFSALENVVIPQLANGVAKAAAEDRARDLLTRVGLGARVEHRPPAVGRRAAARGLLPGAGQRPAASSGR